MNTTSDTHLTPAFGLLLVGTLHFSYHYLATLQVTPLLVSLSYTKSKHAILEAKQ